MQYDDMIRKLKKNRPEPAAPDQLTNTIMNSIMNKEYAKRGMFPFINSSVQWRIIQMTRTILAVASIFLIVFFISEHQGINKRLSKIEANIIESRERLSSTDPQLARFQEISHMIEPHIPVDSLQEIVQINRRSLNFLLLRIKELESENLSFRERLQQYYTDSSTINK